MDLATLGVKVTSSGVKETDAQLESLAKSGAKAEKATESLGNTSQKAGKQASAAMREASMSAGQMSMAMRQLPMQMTDVFTGLASGQTPMMVLIQQGGQLKDSFGGITPAIRAVAGYIGNLINPATLAAGAIATLVAAFESGQSETRAFEIALTLSGNRIGATADELTNIASRLSSVSGTMGKASEVVAELAQSGVIAKDQIEKVTAATIAWEKATGQSTQDVLKNYQSIAQDPVKAMEKLNEQHNFLTPNIYKQVRALQEAGNKAEAARILQEQYTQALGNMGTTVTANAGFLERAWNGIANAAKGAWDAMLGIGREQTVEQKIAEVSDRLTRLQVGQIGKTPNARIQSIIASTQAELDGLQKTRDATIAAANADKERANAVAKTKAEMDKANERDKNRNRILMDQKRALDELTKAQILQAEQVLSFQTDEEKAIAAKQERSDALQKEAERYRDLADPMRKYREELEKIIKLGQTPDPFSGQMILSAEEVTKASDALEKTTQKTGQADDAARQLGLTFSSAFEDAVIKGKGLRDALGGIFQDIAMIFLREGVTKQLASSLMGAFNSSGGIGGILSSVFGGFRANGGDVQAGKAYVVGEKRAELFVPNTSGTIIPSVNSGGVNVSVAVDASGSKVQGDSQKASDLGKIIGGEIRRILVMEQRAGGLLA